MKKMIFFETNNFLWGSYGIGRDDRQIMIVSFIPVISHSLVGAGYSGWPEKCQNFKGKDGWIRRGQRGKKKSMKEMIFFIQLIFCGAHMG